MQMIDGVQIGNRSRNNIEVSIAKLFILFFSVKMFAPFSFLSDITFGLADVFSFLFLALGLICILARGKISMPIDQGTSVFRRLARMFLICSITSLLMAIVLYSEAGTIAGERTIGATSKKILFSIAYIVFVFYGSEVWKLLKKQEIEKIIDISINISLFIGLLQILIIYGFGPATGLYNIINKAFNAWSVELIVRTSRIALLTNEPAYAASYITAFLIPFLLSKFLYDGASGKHLLKLFLCVIVLYFTKSTTGYVLLIVDFVVFLAIYVFVGGNKHKRRIAGGLCILLVLIVVVVIVLQNVTVSSTVGQVLDKLLNADNGNSGDRKAMISANMNMLKNYPIFGVGNGNQGFFYRQSVSSLFSSTYTGKHAFERAGEILFDGGPFWLAFLSGYGLVGIILLISFLSSSVQTLMINKENAGLFFYFYLITVPVLFANGIAATMGNTYFMWFIFGLPVALPSMRGLETD